VFTGIKNVDRSNVRPNRLFINILFAYIFIYITIFNNDNKIHINIINVCVLCTCAYPRWLHWSTDVSHGHVGRPAMVRAQKTTTTTAAGKLLRWRLLLLLLLLLLILLDTEILLLILLQQKHTIIRLRYGRRVSVCVRASAVDSSVTDDAAAAAVVGCQMKWWRWLCRWRR